jgi:uncharacterized protein (TIGR03083 family)
MLGSELRLLGRAAPEHTPRDNRHVKNDAGQRNAVWVDWFCAQSGAEVLRQLQAVTGERLQGLHARGPEDFAPPTQTPSGPGSRRDLWQIRICDAWRHQQDMRRAVKRPGDLEGPVAAHAVGRVAMAMPGSAGRAAYGGRKVPVTGDMALGQVIVAQMNLRI